MRAVATIPKLTDLDKIGPFCIFFFTVEGGNEKKKLGVTNKNSNKKKLLPQKVSAKSIHKSCL